MGTHPPLPEPVRGLRLEERAPSITTLIVEAAKAVSSGSPGPVCASDLLTAVQSDMPSVQSTRFSGFAADTPVVSSRPSASPFAVAAGGEESSCSTESSPASIVDGSSAAALSSQYQQMSQRSSESLRQSMPNSPFQADRSHGLVGGHGSSFGTTDLQGAPHVQGLLSVSHQKHHSESAAADSSFHRQLAAPVSPQHWSSSSLQGHWGHSDSASRQGVRISDSTALALPLSAPSPLTRPAPAGGARRVLSDLVTPPASAAVEGLTPGVKQYLQSMLPDVVRNQLPNLLPTLLQAGVAAALPAASAALSTTISSSPSLVRASWEAQLPTVLEAALAQGLATTLPKAVTATLNMLIKASSVVSVGDTENYGGLSASDPAAGAMSTSAPPLVCTAPAAAAAAETVAVNSGERQQSMSLEQQSAAEAQLVRMLFGADGAEAQLLPLPQQEHQRTKATTAITPCVLDIAAAIASSVNSPASSAASRAGSPAASNGANSPTEQPLGSRPSSANAGAPEHQAPHVAATRRPSLATLTAPAGASLNTAAGDIYSRRLSDTNPGSSIGSEAPTATMIGRPPHLPIPVKATSAGVAPVHSGHSGQQQPCCRSTGGSGGHLGHGEDGVSSVDDALSTCSGGDMPSPYSDLCGGGGAGAANNSSANSFLIAGGSGVDMTGADAAGFYGISGDALLDRLKQVQQAQQHSTSSLGHMASPAELLTMATGAGVSRCGNAGILAGQAAAVQQAQSSQAAVAAATYFLQHQQRSQQQQQQEAEAVAAQQQLQQLQALVASGRPLSEQDLVVPPSPPLSSSVGVQWRRSSGTDVAFGASTADLWQAADADALGFAAAAQLALGQQQQQQQQQAIAAAGLLQQQQQQQQQQQLIAQSLAAVAAASAAGRTVRPEDFLTFASGTGLQLPAATAAGLGSQAAAVQLAAAAAAAAAGGSAAATSTDLASYMDAALRRMLLVSPQVAAELARACGAFSGAHAQLHHLCCIIAEQLLDVAAMAPEVAAALLRALAAHRARGAQATDVDPRVMGRILQLLRAGPAGRQLCLVSLEQWVDGLSRIHKRRAYLDTILHNYQLTLKRLVQAMGHQVHAVNMSLPRQLLNDLSPRALLLLTAELAPYPLLQPRRWSEEIIWTVTQMHAMGIDMPATGVAPIGGPQASAPTSAFQWEIRRALGATADDIAAAGGALAACGQSPPSGGAAGPLAGLAGLSLSCGAAGAGQAATGSSGATTPGGTAVPWAAHAALHRHLLLGLRRVQSRFFSDRLRKLHGLYGESVEALLRSSLPQDVLVPEREAVVLVAVLLMLECRMRHEDFDAAFGRDLQRCLAVSSAEDVAARLRCGLVPDSALRLDPHKSRALSQLLKLGCLPGQPQF